MARPQRTLLWTAATIAVLLLGGCTSAPTQPTVSPTAPPSRVEADVDPAASAVPTDGDENVVLQWEYLPGAESTDPIVDVAQKTTALRLLAQGSPAWNDAGRIDELSRALTDHSDESVSSADAQRWVVQNKPKLLYPVRLLVHAPQTDGDKATVFVCMDFSTFNQEEPVPKSGSPITRIDLAVIDGYWKTTSYNQNTADWTLEDYKPCEDF